MKKIIEKIKKFFKKLFGKDKDKKIVIKTWEECTKSSNWTGSNASKRIMNILSPRMSDAAFEERYAFAKNRGVDHFNLILTNKGDGEKAGYSIYGKDFTQSKGIDAASCNVMQNRMNRILKDGYGIILWMTTDNTAWNSSMDFEKLCRDVKSLGWFEKASAVVLALECDEYWTASQVKKNCKTLKSISGKKVGVHQKSFNTSFMGYGDLAFLQVPPGTSTSKIKEAVKKMKSKKPVCMFEMERSEDRKRCEAAFSAGAWSVGNW